MFYCHTHPTDLSEITLGTPHFSGNNSCFSFCSDKFNIAMWYCTERECIFHGGSKWFLYSSGQDERKADSVTKPINYSRWQLRQRWLWKCYIFSWTPFCNVCVTIYWILLHGHCRTYSHEAKISKSPYFLSSLSHYTLLYSSDCQNSLIRAVQVPWKVSGYPHYPP